MTQEKLTPLEKLSVLLLMAWLFVPVLLVSLSALGAGLEYVV